ncbi:DUF664 domain-containing protein [Lacihabitans sp. LS3-19]|uniref:mycothiol transferase n=1 Tax=Lacihabitans sp. LS3-19 TaxID=2487335 RepID=UPI0020CD1D4E|nr:DUF664 domain-containing protein [Lacihabitans sp. LS3-19]MCP9770693.1 DUF664 domain-containing protein [Lacihabitans sp. LS3-19]
METGKFNRRNFIGTLGISAIGAGSLVLPRNSFAAKFPEDRNLNHIGPMEGYTPQIGALVSMLDWVSNSVISYNKKLTVEQLDYIHDKDSNSIGSLMLHLVATEVIYQDLTFHNLEDFTPENKAKWNIAMDLGEDARNQIKGNPLSYYKEAMESVREVTKAEMKKRDDAWLLSGETKDWDWNNYCKWFHVTEHFANHRGQMTWYAKRLPK